MTSVVKRSLATRDGADVRGLECRGVGPGAVRLHDVVSHRVSRLLDRTAVVVGLSPIVVAIQMRSARDRSSSQTAFAVEEEERSVSKPIVSAASLRAAPLVFDEPQMQLRGY